MKKTILLFLSFYISIAMMAQAPVPTSWDCSGSLPAGYTENELTGANFYTTIPYYVTGPAAYKLDRQLEWLAIAINDVPGALTYQLRGTSPGGTWLGTLKVQESVNGTTWTDLHVYTDAAIDANAFVLQTDNPASTSRFIRFNFTAKVSGYNIGIDDINIASPVAGPPQEIAASYLGNNISNNGDVYFSSPVSTLSNVNIDIDNLGTVNTLNISSAVISGPGAADYSVTSFPSTVAAASNAPIAIAFTPSMAGTRAAVLTIANDDADENPFIINLKGIGGSLATEPAANPTTLSFSNVKAWKMTTRWTTNGSDGYLVLRKAGSPVTDAPVDGEIYDKGYGIGSSKVFYVGKLDSTKVQEMEANTSYHYAVFAYNGINSYTNYKQSSPTTGSQMSGGLTIGTYYSTVDSNSASFVTSLTTKINNHFQVFYSDYDNTIIANYFNRDTIGDQMVLNCDYSGEKILYTPPFDFTATNRSREHCFASSWMPTFGGSGHEDKVAYSDIFNLKLANQNQVNAPRSNHAFGEPTTGLVTYLAASWGQNAIGYDVFTPRTDFRGDIARSLFYMSTCYHNAPNGTSNNSWAWNDCVVAASFGDTAWRIASKLDQSLMKQWAQLDPVSNEEIARAEYISSVQNNRNPYIDHPSWICLVDFNTMSKTANCSVGITPTQAIQASVYPTLASNVINIDLDEVLSGGVNISMEDMQGKKVLDVNTTATASSIDVSNFATGMYMITITSEGRMLKKKVIVQ